MYKLLHLKYMTNKDLLHSAGNSAQYSVNNLPRKGIRKRIDTCYVELTHLVAHLKTTQHC